MIELSVGLVAGMGLGVFYYGALWHTVLRIPGATRPGLLVFVSYLGRLGGFSAGMYGVLRFGGVPSLLAALVAFLAVRQLAVRRLATRPNATAERPADSSVVQGSA